MRRIFGALMIALLFGGTAAVGIAAATDEAEERGWQGVPRVGLDSQYVYMDDDGKKRTYTFTDGGRVIGADGYQHRALLVNGHTYVDEDMRFLQSPSGTGSGSSGSGPVETQTESISYRLEGKHFLPCGMETTIRDHLEAPDRISVRGTCILDGSEALAKFAGHETYLGRPVAVYAVQPDAVVREIWYASGIAVPVKIVYASGGGMELVAQDDGDVWVRDEPVQEFDPVRLVQHGRYGPSGIEAFLPINLPTAVAVARESLDAPEVALFMAEHPDWTVAAARGETKQGPNWFDVSWSFTLQDDADTLRVWVVFRNDEVVVPQTGSSLPWQENSVSTFGHDSRPPPTELIPSVADAATAWQAFVGDDRVVTSVAFDASPDSPRPAMQIGDGPLSQWGTSSGIPWSRQPPAEASEGLVLEFTLDGGLTGKTESRTFVEQTPAPEAPKPAASAVKAEQLPTLAPAVIASSGLIGLLAGGVYLVWPTLKQVVGVGLFSRISHDKAPEHETRRTILDIVRARPGVHYRDLGRLAGLSNGSLEHHVKILLDAGQIVRQQVGRYTCFTLPGVRPKRGPRSAGAKAIVRAIRESPGSTPTQVAKMTQLSEGTVSYHLRAMEKSGEIRSSYENGRRRLAIS